MHEEIFLSSWLREDVEGKDEERENKNMKAKEKESKSGKKEVGGEKRKGLRLTVKDSVWIVGLIRFAW